MCIGLDAAARHKFGRRYNLAGIQLPQTLSVIAGGQGSFQEEVYGYRRGLQVARVARSVSFKNQSVQQLDVPLDSCVAAGAPSSGMFTPTAMAPGAAAQAVLLNDPTGPIVATQLGVLEGATLAPVPNFAPPMGGMAGLVTADLDGDCQDDLVVLPESTLSTRDVAGNLIQQMGGLGANGIAAASADVDGDGNPDLVLVGGTAAHLLLGDGAGGFHEQASSFDVAPTDATAVALGDLDGDGNVDVVIGQGSTTPAVTRVYLNDAKGSGHFVLAAAALPPRTAKTTALALADVDLDGDLDLVEAHDAGQVRLFLNRGNAYLDDLSFSLLPDQVVATVPSLLLTDLNADCLPDLVIPRAGGAPLVWMNSGGGQYVAGAPLAAPESKGTLAGDVNGDGLVDLIAWGANGFTLLVQK
jgi:hypothetical protein